MFYHNIIFPWNHFMFLEELGVGREASKLMGDKLTSLLLVLEFYQYPHCQICGKLNKILACAVLTN